MAQPLSIENEAHISFITTRTAGSRLWFLHNKFLEERILGCLAKYQNIYKVTIYAFILMGNHYHLIAKFPEKNRALFMRDFNSMVARLVGRYVQTHGRRSLWARRYAHQVLLNPEDVHHWFFYTALNPVSSGIVPHIKSYTAYNSFFDAATQNSRIYKWIDWSKFISKKSYNTNVVEDDFSTPYTLTYSKLPGYEETSINEYQKLLNNEVALREQRIREEREIKKQGFLGTARLHAQKLGTCPKETKTSGRYSIRPLALSLCQESRRLFLEGYFALKAMFTDASYRFRNGDFSITFPQGTYPPPRLSVA